MLYGVSAYFGLLAASFVFPFFYRLIHPKKPLNENNKAIIAAITVSTILFGIWDVLATARGHWNFNPEFVWPIRFFGLPLEEWLFYPVVAYSSLFIWSWFKRCDSLSDFFKDLTFHLRSK